MSQTEINNASMLRKGTILRGIYRIDSYLSSGGFGNTYVATNIEFDEQVAIKEFFMKGVTQRDGNQTTVSVSNSENKDSFLEQREKFKKEARRIRQLKNEHIVAVHDLFDENGTSYYVMDYVDGENLSERLKRIGRAMTESEVRLILPQILDALKAVHEAGIWHLDLKPANIMMDNDGKVKLIDFGASKQFNAQKGGATTGTAVSYTNGYAPREQMEQNFEKFGPWTDFYALGATLYTLLSNKRPSLPTDIDDDISEDKHIALPFPESVSDDLKSLILQMLQTNRNLRPQSVDELKNIYGKTTIREVSISVLDVVTNQRKIKDQISEETIINPSLSKKTPNGPTSKKEVITGQYNNRHTAANVGNPLFKGKGLHIVIWILAIAVIISVLLIVIIALNNKSTNNTDNKPIMNNTNDVDYVEEEQTILPQTVHLMPYKTAIGECYYSGQVDDNKKPDGKGKAFFYDGRYYNGLFSHGMLEGKDALFKYNNGDEFRGEFVNNSFYYGKYTVSEDESYFVGSFKNGQPSSGIWYDKNGTKIGDVK